MKTVICKEWHDNKFWNDEEFVALCPADLSERLREMDRVLYVTLFPATNDNEVNMWNVMGIQEPNVVAIIQYITTLEYKIPVHLFWSLRNSELGAIRTWKCPGYAEVIR